MRRDEREWNVRFLAYMDMIVNHPNYKGLPINKKADGSWAWIATAQSDIGKARKRWAEAKAIELGYTIRPGVYAEVMRAVHPTGYKVCQVCGREMSIYYHYPSANFVKALQKEFGIEYSEISHISEVWDDLRKHGFSDSTISSFFITKGGLTDVKINSGKKAIISSLEKKCRKEGKKLLSPGAMSNFPDRYDGFHTYNRCCRSTQDKGRSKENLKSYTKDRRAYEYWSDGNIHAANQFMGSQYFAGSSADHVGPISLGFVHDPRYLQKMDSSDNSTKRDRLQLADIEKIIKTEERTGIYPMSWYSRLIWEFIKENYMMHKSKVSTTYREALKKNMSNFMYVLGEILNNCPSEGERFLTDAFLAPNYHFFNYSYSFNEKGEIINKEARHFTERNQNEYERYKRIAIDSVFDYNCKENRNVKTFLSDLEQQELKNLCKKINAQKSIEECKTDLIHLMETIEKRLISNL